MRYFAIACFLFLFQGTGAQHVSTLMGARAAGTGFVSTVLCDEASFFNNIGAAADIKDYTTFFAYEAQPLLPGANRAACLAMTPAGKGIVGAGFFKFGDDVYNEQTAAIGWSHGIGPTSLGAKLNYVQYQATGFGTRSGMTVTFGSLTHITPQIAIGACLANLPVVQSTGEQAPTILTAGIGFQPSPLVFIGTEVEKNIQYGATWRSGMEYAVRGKVFFRTGFNVNPSAGFLGLGTKIKNLKLDYAVKIGTVLGTAHHASCTYSIKKSTRRP